MTAPVSLYPTAVEDLLPRARELAERAGGMPSRNALMRELKVGAAKANALLGELERSMFGRPSAADVPTAPDRASTAPEPEASPDRSVPVIESGRAVPASVESIMSGPSVLTAVDVDPDTKIRAEAARFVPVPRVARLEAAADAHDAAVNAVRARVRRPVRTWPVYLIALPAAIAIWSGWVGLGGLTGFGVVHPLPGIWDSFAINTAITLPIGVEAYAAFALKAWLSGTATPVKARRFAKWSAIGSLVVGSAGQVAYHLMEAAGMTAAPWQITTAVSCLPVIVLGMAAALAHLLNSHDDDQADHDGDEGTAGR